MKKETNVQPHVRMRRLFVAAVALLAFTSVCPAEDVLLADFEGADYGPWRVTGEAFGNAPARGALPRQMPVDGFRGFGLANSYHKGDDSIGTLTSPSFKIERKFITFLIGGGGYAKETCLNLVVDGKVVCSATGPNVQAGGSERLAPAAWDVSGLAGSEAELVVVDTRKGGWGHINVDHIVLTDERGSVPLARVTEPPPAERTRVVRVDGDYLQLPLLDREKRQQPGVGKFIIEEDGRVLRFLRLIFPGPGQNPDFWYSADVSEFRGRDVVLRYPSHDTNVLDRLEFGDEKIVDPAAYEGPFRPRFHFSPRMGWMNDVNGTHYLNGWYHLFYQSNPTMTGVSTGFDMHWGHSVSRDLVHWEEWPIALHPDEVGNIFSGTAMLIPERIVGINDDRPVPTPGLFFTGTSPFSQHIATTADAGRTWQLYAGNPVVTTMGVGDRDPKVFWHEPSEHYVMILFVGGPRTYRILRSRDLREWEQMSVLPGWNECPEFLPFSSPTTGEDLWLLYGGYNSEAFEEPPLKLSSAYQLGRFDGRTFTPVTPVRRAHQGPNFYAAITFASEPEGRHLMMGWAAGAHFPGESFNGCATLPLRMTLRAHGGEDVLCYEPAREVEALRGQPIIQVSDVSGEEAMRQLGEVAKDALLDITLRFKKRQPGPVEVRFGRHAFTFDASGNRLTRSRDGSGGTTVQLHPQGGVEARILIDRALTECFWNRGEAAYSMGSLHTDPGPTFFVSDEAVIGELVVYPMKNIWDR